MVAMIIITLVTVVGMDTTEMAVDMDTTEMVAVTDSI
jgi:hypothetical protein